MKFHSIVSALVVLTLVSGCSTFSSEPPSPKAGKVQAKKNAVKKPSTPSNQAMQNSAPKPYSAPGTATYAIESVPGNFKDEPTTPSFRAEPIAPVPVENAVNATVNSANSAVNSANATPGVISNAINAAVTPSAPQQLSAQPSIPAAPVAPPQPQTIPIKLEEAAIPAGTSPAVLALLTEADRSRSHGDMDAAVVVMERALRIDSRNPTITYKLAQLRLKQSKPQLAEELAGKAALLAGSNLELKRKSWLLIAEARQLQQNHQGAREAKTKAESFFGR